MSAPIHLPRAQHRTPKIRRPLRPSQTCRRPGNPPAPSQPAPQKLDRLGLSKTRRQPLPSLRQNRNLPPASPQTPRPLHAPRKPKMKTVLIMGASGVFGTRLAQHLAHHSDFKLILAARSAAPLKALAATLPGNPQWRAFDRTTAPLNEIKPWAVVDCSGPFQTTSYDFAKACIVSGAHFVDLADAKDYLAGFSTALDAQAKANQVTALSGASSTPALSSAVVTALSQDWQQIDTVDIAITPGGKSVVGRAVIQAIMSYAGLKIAAYDNGTHCTKIGWKGATHLTIPGLGARLVSPVETFDIPLLADRVRSRITFSAGLESWIEHRGLNTVAWLRSHDRTRPHPPLHQRYRRHACSAQWSGRNRHPRQSRMDPDRQTKPRPLRPHHGRSRRTRKHPHRKGQSWRKDHKPSPRQNHRANATLRHHL